MTKLASHLGKQIANAERSDSKREKMLDRYLGEPYGDEVEGRSEVVTSEVFDVVETITAEMMDVLTSADRIATFRAEGPEDEEAAEIETDACNSIFFEKNPGFETLQTWVKAGLIEQVGYVRSGWIEKRDVVIDGYQAVPELAVDLYFGQIDQDPDVVDRDLTALEDTGEIDGTGQRLVDFTARVVRKRHVYDIEALPQDKVLISKRWRKQSLQDCPLVAIEYDDKTASDLRAMGFHTDDIKALSEADGGDTRFQTEDLEDDDSANDSLTIYGAYVLFDIDGDGIDERLHVWCDEKGKPLHWSDGSEAVEEVEGVPIYAWTPILVPHRHVGRAAAEITDDIQRQNTVLMRSLFDSIYATLYPRPVVNTQEATVDTYSDLALPDHGAPIRTKGPTAIQWTKAPALVGDLLPVLQRMDAAKEERTGVTKLAQGLDKNALTATASGQAALMSQAQKRIKLIARNMAEYGLKELFIGMHRDLRRGNWKSLSFKRAAGWQEANPQMWPARQEMAVSIGTGNGDKIEKAGALDQVIAQQKELIVSGSGLADEVKLFEAMDRRLRLSGFTGAGAFFHDPRSEEYQAKMQAKAQQPKEPSPEMVLAQAEMQKAQNQAADMQQKAQIEMANLQASEARAQREHEERLQRLQLDTERARITLAEAVSKEAREDRKVDLAETKVTLDEQFRRDELQVEVAQGQAQMQQQAQQADQQERQGWFSRWFGGGK